MTVLITGGAGYIGSHMVWECVDKGEDVIVLDNLVTGFDWAVCPQAKLVIGDIADRALVENTIRENNIETIVHFAGSVVVPESFEKPLKYYENNTSRTRTSAGNCSAVWHQAVYIFINCCSLCGAHDTDTGERNGSSCTCFSLRGIQVNERNDDP